MVEETKLIIRMIPIWFTSLIIGICLAEHTTFFVKQSYTMNRKVGRSFEIPAATVNCISSMGMLFTLFLYKKLLISILRRATGNERGLNILQRIGVGMIFPMTMPVAALVEKKRLRIQKNEIARGGGTPAPEALPMSDTLASSPVCNFGHWRCILSRWLTGVFLRTGSRRNAKSRARIIFERNWGRKNHQ